MLRITELPILVSHYCYYYIIMLIIAHNYYLDLYQVFNLCIGV